MRPCRGDELLFPGEPAYIVFGAEGPQVLTIGVLAYPLDGTAGSCTSTGAHAAAFIALIPASHRLDVWLGGATESDDSFPRTDGGHLPTDRIFRGSGAAGADRAAAMDLYRRDPDRHDLLHLN
jgi:hypothetical protein